MHSLSQKRHVFSKPSVMMGKGYWPTAFSGMEKIREAP